MVPQITATTRFGLLSARNFTTYRPQLRLQHPASWMPRIRCWSDTATDSGYLALSDAQRASRLHSSFMATHNPKRLHRKCCASCHSVVWHCIHPIAMRLADCMLMILSSSYRLQNWTKFCHGCCLLPSHAATTSNNNNNNKTHTRPAGRKWPRPQIRNKLLMFLRWCLQLVRIPAALCCRPERLFGRIPHFGVGHIIATTGSHRLNSNARVRPFTVTYVPAVVVTYALLWSKLSAPVCDVRSGDVHVIENVLAREKRYLL
jgi:hypothetical protein